MLVASASLMAACHATSALFCCCSYLMDPLVRGALEINTEVSSALRGLHGLWGQVALGPACACRAAWHGMAWPHAFFNA